MIKKLDISHVEVRINGEYILKDFSLRITPGKCLGIIGPNGAGKSTLLKVIVGLIKPNKGQVVIESENKREIVIGYVPQSRILDDETPIRAQDFISLGLTKPYRPWLSADERQTVRKIMDFTNTGGLAKKPIGTLSGGEKQRVFLAQALVRHPDILLLDESTANLDPAAQLQMMELVENISKSQKITVIYISHDLSMVKQFADQVLYMERNHYEMGETNEMLTVEKLAHFYTYEQEAGGMSRATL